MTTIQDLDTIETTATAPALTTRQRRFVIAFAVFAAVTTVAFLIVTTQANTTILTLTNSITQHLLHK